MFFRLVPLHTDSGGGGPRRPFSVTRMRPVHHTQQDIPVHRETWRQVIAPSSRSKEGGDGRAPSLARGMPRLTVGSKQSRSNRPRFVRRDEFFRAPGHFVRHSLAADNIGSDYIHSLLPSLSYFLLFPFGLITVERFHRAAVISLFLFMIALWV